MTDYLFDPQGRRRVNNMWLGRDFAHKNIITNCQHSGPMDRRITPQKVFDLGVFIVVGAHHEARRLIFTYEPNISKMTPTDVVSYWLSGKGGELVFEPGSYISNEFQEGDGAKRLENLFYAKFAGGCAENYTRMDNVDYTYTWFWRAWNLNMTVQIIGTWKGSVFRDGGTLYFTAKNKMTWNSLTFGRQRAESGYDWLNPEWLNTNTSDVDMIIKWTRDFHGCFMDRA